jgi:hypothetical protein
MYLARFDVGGGEWIQATVRIDPGSTAGTDRPSAAWDLVATQLSAAARIAQATIAYRIRVDVDRVVRQTVAITAPSEHERDVRESVARLTRVERIQGGAVRVPASRDDRDLWMEQLGAYRLCATADGFFVAGIPLACVFRLSDLLEDLLVDACVAGHVLTYQAHVRAADVSPAWVRTARKSMLALRDVPGIRHGLVELQEQLASALGHAHAFCEEYLVVETASATRPIENTLADRFRARYASLGFPPPAFRFEENAYQDQLAAGIHTHDLDPMPPVALCSVAEDAAGRDRLLAWQPSSRLRALFTPSCTFADGDHDDAGEVADAATMAPRPYDGSDPAVFVSYKRADLLRVSRIIRLLQELGLPVWYDRGIPGGTEWDDEIEARLRHARLVVVCASQAALGSKWVRREVKFADSLDVPILPVLLEQVTPANGMGMLLTQYQVLDARAIDFADALRTAVTRLR